MSSKKKKRAKVIWALDTFEEHQELRTRTVELLKELYPDGGASITPVYVLSPEHLDQARGIPPRELRKYKPAAEKALNQRLEEIRDLPEGMESGVVLINEKALLRDAVDRLVRYASLECADLIALASHGRKGLPRFFLGSFAEELIHRSKVPVLMVGPDYIKHAGETILFPTDFSDASRSVFARALAIAAESGSRIELVHVMPTPIEPLIQSGVYLVSGGWIPFPRFMKHKEEKLRKAAAQWIRDAEKKGVKADFSLLENRGSVSDTIRQHCEEKGCRMIALAAQSGPTKAALAGSVARQIVRGAPCPVWLGRKA